MSIDEYIESIAESFDADSMTSSGEYELDGDELYMDDSGNYYTIRLVCIKQLIIHIYLKSNNT